MSSALSFKNPAYIFVLTSRCYIERKLLMSISGSFALRVAGPKSQTPNPKLGFRSISLTVIASKYGVTKAPCNLPTLVSSGTHDLMRIHSGWVEFWIEHLGPGGWVEPAAGQWSPRRATHHWTSRRSKPGPTTAARG